MAPVDPQPQPLQPSYELVVYQLGELRSITEKGFDRIDGRIERVEDEVEDVKTRLTVVEVRQKAAFSLPGSDIVKLLGLIVMLTIAALGGDAAGVGL